MFCYDLIIRISKLTIHDKAGRRQFDMDKVTISDKYCTIKFILKIRDHKYKHYEIYFMDMTLSF